MLTLSEVALADALSLPVAEIQPALLRGELPPPVTIAGRQLWRVGDVQRFVEQLQPRPAAQTEGTRQ